MIGSVNTPGVAKAEMDAVKQTANAAKQAADEAKEAVKAGGVPIDAGSSVAFSLGCDANGVYMVIPDTETEEGGAE